MKKLSKICLICLAFIALSGMFLFSGCSLFGSGDVDSNETQTEKSVEFVYLTNTTRNTYANYKIYSLVFDVENNKDEDIDIYSNNFSIYYTYYGESDSERIKTTAKLLTEEPTASSVNKTSVNVKAGEKQKIYVEVVDGLFKLPNDYLSYSANKIWVYYNNELIKLLIF